MERKEWWSPTATCASAFTRSGCSTRSATTAAKTCSEAWRRASSIRSKPKPNPTPDRHLGAPLRLAAHWAAHWWFWIAAGAGAALALAWSRPYRSIVLKVRRAAVKRGLVELPPGRALQSRDQGFWSNMSWVGLPAGAWVALSPWIWGYDGVDAAVRTDVITGGAVI